MHENINPGHKAIDPMETSKPRLLFYLIFHSFRNYTKRFGFTHDDNYIYCDNTNTTEHPLLMCNRWQTNRENTNSAVSIILNKGNIVNQMNKNDKN